LRFCAHGKTLLRQRQDLETSHHLQLGNLYQLRYVGPRAGVWLAYLQGHENVHREAMVERLGGAAALVDADLAPGPVAMMAAVEEALARSLRIRWCVARNITHPGAIGYYVSSAAKSGFAAAELGLTLLAKRNRHAVIEP
jgi:hypothetical protein